MQVSPHGKQLIYWLLHRDPKNRLGSLEGANEIKNHPFFKNINWALVRCTVTLCHSYINNFALILLLTI